ncbi:hypothetical protein C8R46DRAFT_1084903 [Mycena filopes]|nr:hypothetical protein C8R46DRAFT_1084903 [Mycena filopes]
MKRAADELEGRDTKRQKRDYRSIPSTAIFQDPEQEKNATELLEWSPGEAGFVSGTIRMKWPLTSGKYRVKIQLFSTVLGAKEFDVVFSGRCAEEFQRRKFEFKMGAELSLSLDSAVSDKTSASKVNLPIVLKYSDGVALEMKEQGAKSGVKVDTWLRPPTVEPSDPLPFAGGDWFATPKESRPPVLAIAKNDLMDIDEEPSPSPPEKPRKSVVPRTSLEDAHTAKPLSSIGNSLATATPTLPIPAQPLSRITPPDVDRPPPILAPKEHRRTLTTNDNHASTSKLPESASAAPKSSVAARSPSEPGATVDSEPILTKKQRKNKQRREKNKQRMELKEKASIPLTGAPSIPAATTSTTSPPPNAKPPAVSANPILAANVVPAAQSVSMHIPQTRPPSSSVVPNPPTVTQTVAKPQFAAPPHPFRSISEVTNVTPGPWFEHSVIGVVTSSTSPTRTSKGHWTCCIRIVDPSNCDEAYISTKYEGLTVNCFTPSYQQWLPTAAPGNVIILHQIKVKAGTGFSNSDVVVNGYDNRLKWAVYDHMKGQIGHGDLGEAPSSERLADGHGVPFSPFYEAKEAESAYCLKLDDWWRGVSNKRTAQMGTIHQIGGEPASSRPTTTRKHRLMSEIQGEQYIDCTVRVIHGYQSDRTYILFCTDGTRLAGARPLQMEEIPRSLADYAFQIEMWDAAAKMGPQMRPGEYYHLRNLRMRTGTGGHVEAKLVENKIRKLNPEAEDAADVHLKQLLNRLKPLDDADADAVDDVALTLIKRGKAGNYINCVVELLHKDQSQDVIYVSDYSLNPNLPRVKDTWAHGLDGYVIEIKLYDEQRERMKNLVIGHHYAIVPIRLRAKPGTQELSGSLSGAATLIKPLNPKSSSLEDWKQDLIKRKTALKPPSTKQTEPTQQIVPTPVETPSPKPGRDCVTIKQVLASTECPAKFFVRARVVDFFPFELHKSFVRQCTKCNAALPDNRLACHQCDDAEKQYVRVVSILRLLLDDGEQKIKVSVSGNVPLLDGMNPTILVDDPAVRQKFSERMRPLLNNLEAVHDGMVANELVEPSSGPMMTLAIDNWRGKSGELIYGLRDFEP